MAIKLLTPMFDFAIGTIIRDLSYDIERRLVERSGATYDLSGGVEATVATLNPNLTDTERRLLILEEILFSNRANDLSGKVLTEAEPNFNQGWIDILGDLTSSPSLPQSPGWAKITDDGAASTGIWGHAFDDTIEESLLIHFHIPHGISSISMFPHIHWVPLTTGTGVVRWGLEWAYAKGYGQEAFPQSQFEYIEQAGGGTINSHQIAENSTSIDITGLEPDGLLICRFFRDATHANDTYVGDAIALFVDIHAQVNRVATPNRNFPFD